MASAARSAWLPVAAATATVAAVYLGTVVAPVDAVQGESQRLMYLHVPSVLAAYAMFGLAATGSLHLLAGHTRWWGLTAASAEVGTALLVVGTVTGSVWARLTWGVWWTWDPRLTSTALLLLAYVAVTVVLRSASGPRAVKVGSLGALAAAGLVPIVHFSVAWWRSLHQEPTMLAPQSPTMDARMLVALATASLAVLLGATWLARHRAAGLGHPTEPSTRAHDTVEVEVEVGP